MLYVVDSVTRKWLEQAKQQGQAVSSAAPDGTFAAGVNRVTELMPILMNDIISSAPEDQKVRLHSFFDEPLLPVCNLFEGDGPIYTGVRTAVVRILSAARDPICQLVRCLGGERLTKFLTLAGQDQKARRHLGEGPDLPRLHDRGLQAETQQ